MRLNTFVLVLLAAVLSGTCQNRSDEPWCINPTSPSCETTPYDPPANPGQYEPVGTVHRLLDANGNPTKMWAKLLAEPNPPRGAGITLGLSVCPDGCFRIHMELGFDGTPNPHTVASIGVFFDTGKHSTGRSLRSGESAQTDPSMFQTFDSVPKMLVVRGSYRGDTNGSYGTFPGETGETTFLLDYHQR